MRNQSPEKYLPGDLKSHGKCCLLKAAVEAEVCKPFAQVLDQFPVKLGLIYHFKSKPGGISCGCRWDPLASQGFCFLSWGNGTVCQIMLIIFFFPWAPANWHWHSLYEDKVLVWLEGKFHQSNVVWQLTWCSPTLWGLSPKAGVIPRACVTA